MVLLVVSGPLPWWGVLILVTVFIFLVIFILYILSSSVSATSSDSLVPALQKVFRPLGFTLIKSEKMSYNDPNYFSTDMSQAFGSHNQYQVTRRVLFLDAKGKEQQTVVNYQYNFGSEEFEFRPPLASFL